MRLFRWAYIFVAACSIAVLPAKAMAASLAGNWNGSYECGGLTYQLRLRLAQEKTRVFGILIFTSPTGTTGAFRIYGWRSPIGEIRLNPGEWIDEPAGYFKAALFGETQGANRLIGGVEAEGCGGFHADRE
jgi:hypothetical protein